MVGLCLSRYLKASPIVSSILWAGAGAYLELHYKYRAYHLAIFAPFMYPWLVRIAWIPLFVIYLSVGLNGHIYTVKHEVDIKVQ